MQAKHCVTLEADKCVGCINCMKRCPTEAIRVRNGKASINYAKCNGCGECIRVCTHHAKKAHSDSFGNIALYSYKIALVDATLYAQFNHLDNINIVLQGVLDIGFDAVFEVAQGAELVSQYTAKILPTLKKPVLSTACPAITELVLMRFHNLSDNLLPLAMPVDVVAKLARKQAEKIPGLASEDIGIFYISPCASMVSALKSGLGWSQPLVDGVLSTSDVYFPLVNAMNNITNPPTLSRCGQQGLSWSMCGGEASQQKCKHISVDGIDNCIAILQLLEDDKLSDIDFIELCACPSGCVGGVLNIENAYVAKSKLETLSEKLPNRCNTLSQYKLPDDFFVWDSFPDVSNALSMGSNRIEALAKLAQAEEVFATLPKLDCCACGAPSCRAFSEDVARGLVPRSACKGRRQL